MIKKLILILLLILIPIKLFSCAPCEQQGGFAIQGMIGMKCKPVQGEK